MPYKYFGSEYESKDEIEKDYRDPYKHPRFVGDAVGKERRLAAARKRASELHEYELKDQMAARTVTLNVDLRNKYQIKATIDMLTQALKSAENEVYEVPYTGAMDIGRKD